MDAARAADAQADAPPPRKLTPRKLLCLCTLFVILVLGLVLLALSVHIVPINHIALAQNYVRPGISEGVFDNGRHLIGVGRRFHTFPTYVQLIDFSWLTAADSYGDEFFDGSALSGYTADGVAVTMAATVFCRIRREELRELFMTYCYMKADDGEFGCRDRANAQAALRAQEALLDAISKTVTEDFFKRREKISGDMMAAVSAAIAPVHYDVELFSLREIQFDTIVDEAITDKIVTAQKLQKVILEADTRLVQADQAVLVAEGDTDIAWQLSAADAERSTLEAAAEADAFLLQVVAETNGTRQMRDELFLPAAADDAATANDAVLTRQYYADVIADMSSTRVLVGNLNAQLLAALPTCACVAGSCPESGWCEVTTGTCRGSDGKLASYYGPDGGNAGSVAWWSYCNY